MPEERLVAGAQVVESKLTVGGAREAVLGTLSIAGEADGTFPAVLGQGVALGIAEGALLGRSHELDHVGFENVPEEVAGLHEMVT